MSHIKHLFKKFARWIRYSHPGIRSCLKTISYPLLHCCSIFNNWRHHTSVENRCARSYHDLIPVAQKRRERAIQNRKRSLSVDDTMKRRIMRKKTKDQLQSPLFGRLPGEIRNRIYEAVLCGSGRLHVGFADQNFKEMRLASVTCLEPSSYFGRHDACLSDERKRERRIAVLLTCKRA
jgi:hypothetical protein